MYKIKSFLQETKNQFDLKSINQCPCNFIRQSLNDSHHTPHYYTIKYCFQYLFIIIVIAILLIYLLNTIFDFCVFFLISVVIFGLSLLFAGVLYRVFVKAFAMTILETGKNLHTNKSQKKQKNR